MDSVPNDYLETKSVEFETRIRRLLFFFLKTDLQDRYKISKFERYDR